MTKKYNATYKIINNNDWKELETGEELVDVSNNAYFGFRAMEKKSKAIIYDPIIIDSLIRLGKDSRKFSKTKHILILDADTLGYESLTNDEAFLKHATRVIEELFELNPLLCIGFLLKMTSEERKNNILSILKEIYPQ